MSRLRQARGRGRLPAGLGERGSLTLEAAILMPGLLLFIGLIVFAGRMSLANQSVGAAAEQAARTGSIARSQSEADRTATTTGRAYLAQQSPRCLSSTVQVDTSGFNRPPGTPATITTTVSCVVRLSDLAMPGLPGSRTVRATASSPLDTYRGR